MAALLLGLLVAVATAEPALATEPARFVVAGYAPDYRLGSLNLPAMGKSLSHVILFSISPLANGSLASESIAPVHMMQVGRVKASNPALRALISVGGGGRSEHYASVATDKKARKRFAKSLAKYCSRNKLDGADLDWEAPSNAEEAAAYQALAERVRKEFDRATPRLELTMAVHPGGHVEMLEAATRAVDRVHLMAYDMPDRDPERCHSSEEATASAVAEALAAGIPREKLVMGLPFYGRDTSDPRRAEAYRDLWRRRGPDDAGDLVGRYCFNSLTTVMRKAVLAAREGLAGVMIWELGQDDDHMVGHGSRPLLPGIGSVASLAPSVGWQAGKQLDEAAANSLLALSTAGRGSKEEL